MNHIIKLQNKVEIYENALNEIMSYLYSSKFSADQNVNKQDIINRINETKSAIGDLDFTDSPTAPKVNWTIALWDGKDVKTI